jgi:hypothetical protein
MSRVIVAVDFGSTRSPASSAKILTVAPSCAGRAQLSLGGLGVASGLPLLRGAF